MGAKTGISWTDSTWSPIRVRVKSNAADIAREKGYTSLVSIAEKMSGRVGPHCEKISPGCVNCYAETNNHRCLPANGTGLPYDRRSRDLVEAFVDEKILLQPLSWKGTLKIFVENQSDLFGDWVTDEMLDQVFAVAALCPQHTFQVLTKRPERMLAYLTAHRNGMTCKQNIAMAVMTISDMLATQAKSHTARIKLDHMDRCFPKGGGVFPNVHLGVSVENQKTADERIPLLLQTPAAVRFISAEPLLGHVMLRRLTARDHSLIDVLSGIAWQPGYPDSARYVSTGLDWVIVGGESGHGARPMHPDWARSLRDQCKAAGVPFFFKQWGEWGDWDGNEVDDIAVDAVRSIVLTETKWATKLHNVGSEAEPEWRYKIGTKAAGHLLDGVEHHEFPAVRA